MLAYLNTNIRILGIHIRALALNSTNAIHYRILNPLRTIHGVVDMTRGTYKIDSNTLRGSKVALPGNIVALLI